MAARTCRVTARCSLHSRWLIYWPTCTRSEGFGNGTKTRDRGLMRFRSWDNFPVKKAAQKELFRLLPSVDELMHGPRVSSLTADHGHAAALDAVRAGLERLRRELGYGELDDRGVDLALSNLDVWGGSQL